MNAGYPLLLDVAARRVVVVGGGPVAARRARSLADAGAHVTVVAPRFCAALLSDARFVRIEREYRSGDLDGAWLAHTCTGVPAVDAAVAADADAARVWCVRADDADASRAWTPAVARDGDVVVAVNAGGDPRRAVALRDAVATSLATGELPVRHHRRAGGHVALVGGGPGDPGLITVRGRRLLADADVVVVDRLAPRALLDTLPSGVEVIEAGKSRGHHAMSQDAINDLLVARARAGQRVVRLKGGDPFVFGRGGEEALACAAAGVPCEIVPGVTSAIGAAAAAGIPVTHRGLARQFAVVTGHGDADSDTDWASLARFDGTVVVLMAVSRLAQASAALIAHGRDGSTPAAMVESGTTPRQRTTTATLATIAARAAEVGVRSPAILVVGDVVALHETLGPGGAAALAAAGAAQ